MIDACKGLAIWILLGIMDLRLTSLQNSDASIPFKIKLIHLISINHSSFIFSAYSVNTKRATLCSVRMYFRRGTSFSSTKYYIFSFRKCSYHVFRSLPCMKLVCQCACVPKIKYLASHRDENFLSTNK